jgi:hypothetical protein
LVNVACFDSDHKKEEKIKTFDKREVNHNLPGVISNGVYYFYFSFIKCKRKRYRDSS